MKILRFVFSKVFLLQLIFATILLMLLSYGVLKWLDRTTNHGEFIEVPVLIGKTLDVTKKETQNLKLQIVVQDSANYNPNYPIYSVIEQSPMAKSLVKEQRKIYLTLNPSGYRNVGMPNIIRRTFRQAKPTLDALGFEIGNISYSDDIGKDEVLKIQYKGKNITPGMLLRKKSKIDLVLGNGSRGIQIP